MPFVRKLENFQNLFERIVWLSAYINRELVRNIRYGNHLAIGKKNITSFPQMVCARYHLERC